MYLVFDMCIRDYLERGESPSFYSCTDPLSFLFSPAPVYFFCALKTHCSTFSRWFSSLSKHSKVKQVAFVAVNNHRKTHVSKTLA